MPEALVWRDDDGGRQRRPNKYDEYVYRWKSPSGCGPKWLETNSSIEERPRQDVLNATIDKIYDELAELIARRSSQPDPTLEKQISTLFQQLRDLQKQEGDLVREYTKAKLAGPIAAGLDILKRADEIRARYGIATAMDTATPDPNISKT